MQFFDVEGDGVQQDFREYPFRASPPQTPEMPVLFQYSKGSFRLDAPIDPQQDAFLAHDPFPGGCPSRLKCPIDFDRSVFFCFCAGPFVWTICAILRLIQANRLFKPALCFPLGDAAEVQLFSPQAGMPIQSPTPMDSLSVGASPVDTYTDGVCGDGPLKAG